MRFIGLVYGFGCLAYATSSHALEKKRVLHALDQKITVTQTRGHNNEFFLLCHDQRLPCGSENFGEEIRVWPPLQSPMNYRQETMTLRSALDRIVKLQPRYRWQIVDGVLLLSPCVANRTSPLVKRIPEFKTLDGDLRNIAAEAAKFAGIRIGLTLVPGNANPREKGSYVPTKITLNKKDASIREILNSAVLADGSAMWEYAYASPARGGHEPALSIYIY
jgi:hypothetical protein